MYRKIKQLVLKKLISTACWMLEKKTNYPLEYFAALRAEEKFFKISKNHFAGILDGEKCTLVDVGASGGLEKEWQSYRAHLDVTLCEANPEAALTLKASNEGDRVFNAVVGSSDEGDGTLNIGKHAGSSSCFGLNDDNVEFYTSGRTERFRQVGVTHAPKRTLASLLTNEISNIDFLKIDTQGYELEVLKGMGSFRPILLKVEVSYIQLYDNQSMFYELYKHMYDLGYILFHESIIRRTAPAKYNSRKPFDKACIPMHGDVYFMPSWEHYAKIVGNRHNQFKALMHLFALDHVYDFALAIDS